MTDLTYLGDLHDQVHDLVKEFRSNMDRVSAEDIGLDPRAGLVYVGEDCIAVTDSYRRVLEYYGGFEYVSKDCVHTMGDTTFYSDDSDRVRECIEHYEAIWKERPKVVAEDPDRPGLIA